MDLNNLDFPTNCSESDMFNCARISIEDFHIKNETCILKKQNNWFLPDILTMREITN